MNIRKDPLVCDHYYHIYSRSIAKFNIFNDDGDFSRFLDIANLYRFINFNYKYSKFDDLQEEMKMAIKTNLKTQNQMIIEIVAYCVMPTHIHLLLKQTSEDGISKYMAKILNSYTRYFNFKYHRKGPLWEGHFKNVLVNSDEQLLHLTRYIHLNPSSAGLVEKPEEWSHSSYLDYIDLVGEENSICNYKNLFDFSAKEYQLFVNDRKSYQRDLSIIKSILIDDYAG